MKTPFSIKLTPEAIGLLVQSLPQSSQAGPCFKLHLPKAVNYFQVSFNVISPVAVAACPVGLPNSICCVKRSHQGSDPPARSLTAFLPSGIDGSCVPLAQPKTALVICTSQSRFKSRGSRIKLVAL